MSDTAALGSLALPFQMEPVAKFSPHPTPPPAFPSHPPLPPPASQVPYTSLAVCHHAGQHRPGLTSASPGLAWPEEVGPQTTQNGFL